MNQSDLDAAGKGPRDVSPCGPLVSMICCGGVSTGKSRPMRKGTATGVATSLARCASICCRLPVEETLSSSEAMEKRPWVITWLCEKFAWMRLPAWMGSLDHKRPEMVTGTHIFTRASPALQKRQEQKRQEGSKESKKCCSFSRIFSEATVPMTPSPAPYGNEQLELSAVEGRRQGAKSQTGVSEYEGMDARELSGQDFEAPLEIDIEVLEFATPLTPCVPQRKDAKELAAAELSAPFGIEIATSGKTVVAIEQKSAWKSEQTRSREKEGVQAVRTESSNAARALKAGVSGRGIILEERPRTLDFTGSEARSNLQPCGSTPSVTQFELEGMDVRVLEGPDFEAPLEIDVEVLEFTARLAP